MILQFIAVLEKTFKLNRLLHGCFMDSYCIETSEIKSILLSQNKQSLSADRYSDRFKSRRVDCKTFCTDRKCHRMLVFKTRQNRGSVTRGTRTLNFRSHLLESPLLFV